MVFSIRAKTSERCHRDTVLELDGVLAAERHGREEFGSGRSHGWIES
jgi:hypothetical protein